MQREEEVSRGKDAIILIDLQVDYISGGDLLAGQISPLLEAFPELPENVEQLLKHARENKIDIIHVRERDCPVKSKWLPSWDKIHPSLGATSCGLGVEAHPEPWAQEVDGEPVFVKHTYDAFQSGDASKALLNYLEERDIKRLFFCGVLTKACVMFSANSAFNLGYEVYVVSDCCADRTREHHDMALGLYDGYHIQVIGSGQLQYANK